MSKGRYISTILLFGLISFSIIQLPLLNLFQGSQSSDTHAVGENSPRGAAPPDLSWWNVSWWYRKTIKIASGNINRSDSLFEAWFNFTDILKGELSLSGKTFDNNSIRLIEYNEVGGDPIVHNSSATQYPTTKYEVPYSLWYDNVYNALTNARVKISWVLNGTTLVTQNRTYSIYFDTTEHELKEAPHYWVTTAETISTTENIRSTDSRTTNNLWSIKSSNLSVYVSNSTGTDATLQGQPTRLQYIAGGSTISDYRMNYALMDFSQLYLGGTVRNINIASMKYQDNKILIPQAFSNASFTMNITYEMFENSIFTKVTYSFLATATQPTFEVRWHGDLSSTPSTGNDVNQQRFLDSEGESYTGNPSKITDIGSAPSWVVFDDTVTGHNDLLGFILPTTSRFQFLKNGKYVYDLWGNITSMASGNYQEFSYYLVTSPKGVSSYWSPVEDLCKDLVTTPKTYTQFNAEIKTMNFIVTVKDSDGFVVPNARVYLNASTDLSVSLQNTTTDDFGICTFSDIDSGYYNFSVSLSSDVGIKAIEVNGSAKFYPDETNILLNASIWTIQFDILDRDNKPLPAGWISINHSLDGAYSLHNLSLNNGLGTFRWENNSDYNYTVFYSAPGYNNGVPIVVNSSIIQQQDHAVGFPTTITIHTALTTINFTVQNSTLSPIPDVIIRVFNSSNPDGTPNISDMLADLEPTDASGKTQFYWNSRDDSSNYSLWVNVGGAFNALPLNKTNYPSLTWTVSDHYQNFTMISTMNKTILVNLAQETAVNLVAELIPVNDPFDSVYWGSKIMFQVLYQHNNTEGVMEYASPSLLRYTLKLNENVLVGPVSMNATSQTGRFEALIDTAALGIVVGNTYSIKIEAAEGGYQPITPLVYWIQVKSLSTTLNTTPNQVTAIWGDIASTQVEYQTDYSNTIDYEYLFFNSSAQDFTFSIPRIQNQWNLTDVEFNFTEIVSGGTWTFSILKGGSEVKSITNPETVATVTGPWSDDNLTFSIVGGGVTSFNVTARCFYARIGVIFNQTILNINGDSTIEVDKPGFGWKLTGLVADLWSDTGNLANLVSLKIGMYDTPHLISGSHIEIRNLNYYLNPLRNFLNLTFTNSSAVTFNASFSFIFTPVTLRHDLAETDIKTYTASAPTGVVVLDLSSDKMWEIDAIDLQFSGFLNIAYELVDPAAIGLELTYAGVDYPVIGGPGYFYVSIDSPTQSDLLAFSLSTPDISAYNLTVIQSYGWVNRWNVQGGTVSYSVFSNSSITGNAIENSTYHGLYDLDFLTNRTSVGTQLLRISASYFANEYETATFDLPLFIKQIPTTVNGSKVFYWNRQIYKTESSLFYAEYYDTHNNRAVTGANATFIMGYYGPGNEDHDIPDWSTDGTLTEFSPGLYVLDFDTEFLVEGTYKFAIALSTENGAYEPRTPTLTMKINLIPGNLSSLTTTIISRIQRQNATYSFQLVDNRTTHLGEIYPQSETGVSVAFAPQSGTFSLNSIRWINGTGDGIFNLTVDTRTILPGTYGLQVTFTRENYTVLTKEITLTVTAFQPTIDIPTSVQLVTEGEVAQIQITILDGLKGMSFSNIQIDWVIAGTTVSGSLSTVSPTDVYIISVPTTALSADVNYNLEISISVTVEGEPYVLSQVQTVNIRVEYTSIFGIPRPYFLAIIIAIGVMIGIFIMYRWVIRARIPETIKQIDRTFGDIKKSRTLTSIDIAPSKENQYAERFAADWQLIGVNPPWVSSQKSTSKKVQKTKDSNVEERNPEEVDK